MKIQPEQLRDVLFPAVFWTAGIALCDLIFYPMLIPAASPVCGVPAYPPGYSADHFGRVLLFFFVYLAIGVIAFGVARLLRRPRVATWLLFVVCGILTYVSFDHDYPSCNSLPPRQSFLLSMTILILPTTALWVWWRARSQASSASLERA